MTSPEYYIPPTTHINSPYASQQHSNPNNNYIMLVPIVILFCVIFLIACLHIPTRVRSRSSNRNSYTRHFPNPNQANSNARSSTASLSKDAIAQLPTFIYKVPTSIDLEAGENTGLLECAVCLSEFQEGEKGRLLPSCKHSFHIECIDMWFSSHSTCPLCRAVIVPTITTSPLIPITISTHEQQQGAEAVAFHEAQNAIEAASSTHESNPLNAILIPAADDNTANAMAQIPTNVLFCADSIQFIPSQMDSSQSSKKPFQSASSSSSSRPTRGVPHITVEIPTGLDISLTSPSWRSNLSSRRSKSVSSAYEPAYSSRKSLKSPSLRESVKRMLSIQSRQGNMESPR